MSQLKMKPIKLICLVLALIFTAVGCEKKEPEPARQADVEAEGEPTKPPEPARRTMATKPLHQAAEKGDIDQVQSHISQGADVNAKDDRNSTPLHYAAWKGHKDVAQLLIANAMVPMSMERVLLVGRPYILQPLLAERIRPSFLSPRVRMSTSKTS
jgi:hypothetical protein